MDLACSRVELVAADDADVAQPSVGPYESAAVIVLAVARALEDRDGDVTGVREGELAQRLGGRAGNRLGQVAVARVVRGAEVRRGEELGQHDERGGEPAASLVDPLEVAGEVRAGVERRRVAVGGRLHERDGEGVPHRAGVRARRGTARPRTQTPPAACPGAAPCRPGSRRPRLAGAPPASARAPGRRTGRRSRR